jgi:xanthine dehydrogenase accessory factor
MLKKHWPLSDMDMFSPVDFYRKALAFIDAGTPFAVAQILGSDGSTAAKVGAKALVDGTGRIWGTVGGGAVEGAVQKHAVAACESKRAGIFDFDLQHEYAPPDAKVFHPICGGTMRILVAPEPEQYRASFIRAADALKARERGVLLTTLTRQPELQVNVTWRAADPVEQTHPYISASTIQSSLEAASSVLIESTATGETSPQEVLIEPVIPLPRLIIAGGGHIGQALALQANIVGFDVVVIDERPEYAQPDRYPEGTTTLSGPWAEVLDTLSLDKDTYLVSVTTGYAADARVLTAIARKPLAYIGMIGSTRKVAMVKKELIASGIFSKEEFEKIYAPVGLPIGAYTVPEIATSILAELIAVRRGMTPGKGTQEK